MTRRARATGSKPAPGAGADAPTPAPRAGAARPRRGRRPGDATYRASILTAAREAFGELGYDGAAVRDIAGRAGVDPAMLHHYFGSKERLFQEVVEIPFDPRAMVAQGEPADPDQLGAHLVATMIRVWDSPQGSAALALLRSAARSDVAARMLREYLMARVIRPIVARVETDPERAAWRGSLVVSQMVGLIVARFLLRVEPVASAQPPALIALVGPQVQRYLTGDLSL